MNATVRPAHVAVRPVRGRPVCGVGLAACICYAVVQAHLSAQLGGSIAPPALPVAEVQGSAAAPESSLSSVAALHLFGVYRDSVAPPLPPPMVIRETPPGLRLQGVFTSSEGVEASALIAIEGSASARRFQPGDQIFAEVELVSVALDHVVLRRAGELQRLSLYRAEGGAGPAASGGPARRSTLRWARRPHASSRAAALPEPERATVVMTRLRRLRAMGG